MNKLLKYRLIFIALCAAAASCSEWTETQSIGLREADIAEDDPELYAQYLASLREYRLTDHKIIYAWFDNPDGTPASRGQHISAIPDSVDVVCVMNPDGLQPWAASEMETAARDKGMRFVFNISHYDLEREYERYVAENTPEDGEEPQEPVTIMDIETYTAGYVDGKLALAELYAYDGLSVLFYGMDTIHLTEEEKEAYLSKEAAFMSKIREWIDLNPGKLFVFEGNPQNVTDQTILQDAGFIVVRTESVRYVAGLTFEVRKAMGAGVPADRFLIMVSTVSTDPSDNSTGYYIDTGNNPVTALPLAAEWVSSPEAGFTKLGLAVLNLQNDYYIPQNSYGNVREAIAIMNPSPKL